jgi:cell division protein DivIC
LPIDILSWPLVFLCGCCFLIKVEAAKKYYQDEIEKTKKQLNNLQNNPASVEKYARERYLLRREGEEVYLFEDTMPAQPKK